LYLDIRDIFVDSIEAILPRWLALPLGRVFSGLERHAIGSASRVNLVSRGFEPYFSRRYPRQHFSYFPNGIDAEFIGCAPEGLPAKAATAPYSVLYAGNLGEGQGLHAILPALARAMRGQVNFTVIGDGGRKQQLRQALDQAGVDNVTLRDPVNRSELVRAYQDADVLILHLNDDDAFRKVLPSKLFEYAATGKPIWAGVAGHAAEFIAQEVDNTAVFAPCDAAAAVRAFSGLRLESTPRPDFVGKYARASIMQSLAADIISTAEGPVRA
jgi:glycosyltransferase involved in cell wall biosynthesis